jgi:hypothetical protein
MPLHDQISPFDEAELAQFVKVSLDTAAFLGELGGIEDGNAFCDRRTSARLCMRPARKAEGHGRRPRDELPPLHVLTLNAPPLDATSVTLILSKANASGKWSAKGHSRPNWVSASCPLSTR